MIRVEMNVWEADNGYTFEFHSYNPNAQPGSKVEQVHKRVCVEGKDAASIKRLEGSAKILLQEFFEVVKQDIRESTRVR